MLNRKTYFIREHAGIMKLNNTFDILDPETQEQIGIAKEKRGGAAKILRFFVNKKNLPTKIFVYEGDNYEDDSKLLFYMQRGFYLFRSSINIYDANHNLLGWFKSKMLTLGGAFTVYDAAGSQVARIKGDWKGWNFVFLDNMENEIGTVTKKWAGMGKELFTTADNYMIALNQESAPDKAILLLAAGLAIDTVYKEK
ncbi:MAG: oxidoreductase [Chloroflexi bacterium]|nr:oxidoreductase [Chloroflexota bacterium]MBT7082365.1 oxidoreductase [Chloroflexota bacterium]